MTPPKSFNDVRPHIPKTPQRFVDQFRLSIRTRGLSYATEKTYVHWVLRYIRFHRMAHPEKLDAAAVSAFLNDLAQRQHCSPGTQRIALNALVFLYSKHLNAPFEKLAFTYARRAPRAPSVFTHAEAMKVIDNLGGQDRLAAGLMYGAGLRLNETLTLRLKDIDFAAQQITIRNGKGQKDRFTLLPASLVIDLEAQIEQVARLHQYDLSRGYGDVYLPDALERKFPKAGMQLAWQFLFPANGIGVDPRSGVMRRHHRHSSTVQRAVRLAIQKSGFPRRASCHTFRHSFATRLIETGYDIKLVQSLLGHRDIRTTEIYLHVVRNRAGAIKSPVDLG
ncbi:MAG: integron integrase [Woeseiaceae bacterium]